MKLGFMTNVLVAKGMKALPEIASWAVDNGFSALEVGPTVPLDEKLYSEVLSEYPIKITALTYCRNFLSTDEAEAENHIAELRKRICFASNLGIEKIVTSTGIDKTVEEGVYDRADAIRKIPIRSLDKFVSTFEPIIKLAEENNVKLAFENCPLMGNIAISPYMWREIFARIDSPMVGITYDPSHLIWQMIDPYKPIEEFSSHIFHIHAKDTIVDREVLAETGILTDFSWWQYVIPGNGEIDWRRLIDLLKENGFTGTISIEHEDKNYENTLEDVKDGILRGRSYLEQFIKKEENKW